MRTFKNSIRAGIRPGSDLADSRMAVARSFTGAAVAEDGPSTLPDPDAVGADPGRPTAIGTVTVALGSW